MELVLSINTKLSELKNMKTLLDVEMRENECLGTQVMKLTKACCKPREQEKYVLFVQDVDKIINLLLSLSARLARAENSIQMHPVGADKQEMVSDEKRVLVFYLRLDSQTLFGNVVGFDYRNSFLTRGTS